MSPYRKTEILNENNSDFFCFAVLSSSVKVHNCHFLQIFYIKLLVGLVNIEGMQEVCIAFK